MMSALELRQKTEAELAKLIADWRVQLHDLSLRAATRQLKDVKAIRGVKRDLARCLTILNERRGK